MYIALERGTQHLSFFTSILEESEFAHKISFLWCMESLVMKWLIHSRRQSYRMITARGPGAWVQILTLPLMRCLAVGWLLYLSELLIPYL